jgi:hypothetical protein
VWPENPYHTLQNDAVSFGSFQEHCPHISYNYIILSYCTFSPVILYATNGTKLFCCGPLLVWQQTETKYNLPTSSGPNLEKPALSLLSIIFHNSASSCKTETTNHSQTIMHGGQHPILSTSKFMSVYHVYDPFEGNEHVIIWKRELLASSFRKFAVTLLKTWKL